MARKPTKPVVIQVPLELLASQEEAADRINNRINKGREFLNSPIQSSDQLAAIEREYAKWSDFNKELLRRLFTNDSLSEEYNRTMGPISVGFGRIPSLGEEIRDFMEKVNRKIHKLESINERLELIPCSQDFRATKPREVRQTAADKVFIVHGHDEGACEATARFIEKLNLSPIILHEQVNGGRTIFEKLEHHSDVNFAVVLLTPDDVGGSATEKGSLNPRARQNVILELGYFVGKLGRAHVCALHKGPIELPSDIVGVVYVDMDKAGAWRLLLARELRGAGFDVDLNLAL